MRDFRRAVPVVWRATRSSLYHVGFRQLGYDWNDYRDVQHLAGDSLFFSPLANARLKEFAYDEQLRWNADYERNTGLDPLKSKYPIRNGYYGNYVGNNDYFEASEAVVNQFSRRLYKW